MPPSPSTQVTLNLGTISLCAQAEPRPGAAPHTEPVSSSLETSPPPDFWVKGQTFQKSSIFPGALRKGASG